MAAPAAQADTCTFAYGFAQLHNAIPNVVGDCVENAHGSYTHTEQHTTNGLLVWDESTGPEFTNGYQTWALDSGVGIQVRLNTQCFSFEPGCAAPVDGVPASAIAPPPAAAAITPASAAASPNWAGYVATGGPFVEVQAQWTIPRSIVGPNASQGAWIGIGGYPGLPLIQAGTGAKPDSYLHILEQFLGAGQGAWFEDYPQPSVPLTIPALPGQAMSVDISQTNGRWTMTMTNETAGATVTEQGTYSADQGSAEWIVEAPGLTNGSSTVQSTLARTNPVTFWSAWAKTASGQIVTPRNGQVVDIVQQGQTLAVPGPAAPMADTAGDTFTVLAG